MDNVLSGHHRIKVMTAIRMSEMPTAELSGRQRLSVPVVNPGFAAV